MRKYSGNPTRLAAEIEKKLVHDHQSGKKKGVEQLAEAVKVIFGADGETTFPQISLKGIKRVYLYNHHSRLNRWGRLECPRS